MEKTTPLYQKHIENGGKIVPFAGYLLPVEYSSSGVIAEHMAVRESIGMFDVSHMAEIVYEGKDALANLQLILTNDLAGMYDGQARYSPMCNDNGGIIDDLIVYKMNDEKYLTVCNAANREKDVNWMKAHLFGDVNFSDISDSIAQIAIQGPKSKELIAKLCDDALIPKKYYSCVENSVVGGISCILSRTGYTGEFGYEVYCASEDAEKLWDLFLNEGKEYGLIPCGLGARDTLRLEAAMPLYGHEMNDEISPLEANLHFAVKMTKENFIGKAAIEARGEPKMTRVGFKVVGRGIVREHSDLILNGEKVGYSTSGTHSPYLKTPIAMGYVAVEHSAVGTHLFADVRGRQIEVEIIPLPFYKRA